MTMVSCIPVSHCLVQDSRMLSDCSWMNANSYHCCFFLEDAQNSWPFPVPRSSVPGEKTETLILQTVGEKKPPSMGLTWEQSPVTRPSRTGTLTQSRTSLPGLPELAAMQLSVCLQDWWKVFGSDCCLPGVPRWPMGSAYSW